jgi:hypothetical protein
MTRFKTRLYHKASGKVYSTYMVQETDSGPMYWFKIDDNLIYATEEDVVVMNNIGDGKTFVGDIVSLTNINNWYVDKKTLGVVGYDKLKYCFTFISMSGLTYSLSGKDVIIHGNIFDNPEIKIIPASGTFCQGQPILLSAQLSGTTVSIPVFWQQSRNGTNWVNIPGADSTNYRFPAADSGLSRVTGGRIFAGDAAF